MTLKSETSRFTPSSRLANLRPYSPGERKAWIDLFLDANEGTPVESGFIQDADRRNLQWLQRYPNAASLEETIATGFKIDPSRVVVTNGADDAIDRLCRISLEPGRDLVVHTPTFEMIARSAMLSGASVTEVPWQGGEFPLDAFLRSISDRTGLVAIVSPNNPTGAVVGLEALGTIAERASQLGALVLVDLAYIEFADDDPTSSLLSYENVVVVRTLSKAYGLAGLRVGYAIGAEPMVTLMRVAGAPYPVSSLSLTLAERAFKAKEAITRVSARVCENRRRLTELLIGYGCEVGESQANFILVRTTRAEWLCSSLAALGIAVRLFKDKPQLANAIRITIPVDENDCARLIKAIEAIFSPAALLFDLDGVLADVSGSYRQAIIATAESFGVTLTPRDIQRAKDAGDANNDWIVTHRLLAERGVDVLFDEVKFRFQRIYLGNQDTCGARETETLTTGIEYLETLRERWKLALVTGRPRAETQWFLERFGLTHLFEAVVCMEDAPAKPSAQPVNVALQRLGVQAAWMIGDTPDDIVAARNARVLPIGVVAPGQDQDDASNALRTSGAAAVLSKVESLTELLP